MILEIGTTKILRTRYKHTNELYEVVSDKIKDITNQPNNFPMFIVNGRCSFHNKDDAGRKLYEWEDFKDFVLFLKQNVRDYLESIDIQEQDAPIAGMWANRYPPGTFVTRHNHNELKKEKTIIIGALFYIKTEENAGDLVIDIPSYGEYNANMSQGDVIIFQSSLDHWTTPNRSDNDKYVIGLELVVGENGRQLDEI
jgi:hypothetical protein